MDLAKALIFSYDEKFYDNIDNFGQFQIQCHLKHQVVWAEIYGLLFLLLNSIYWWKGMHKNEFNNYTFASCLEEVVHDSKIDNFFPILWMQELRGRTVGFKRLPCMPQMYVFKNWYFLGVFTLIFSKNAPKRGFSEILFSISRLFLGFAYMRN